MKPTKKKPNAYARIQAGKREREKTMLWCIKHDNKNGKGFDATGLMSSASRNAMDRLEAKGRIKYRKFDSWGKNGRKRGYWIVQK